VHHFFRPLSLSLSLSLISDFCIKKIFLCSYNVFIAFLDPFTGNATYLFENNVQPLGNMEKIPILFVDQGVDIYNICIGDEQKHL